METSNIKIYADYQRLTVRSGVMRYASDTFNYVRAEFELGNGWQGFDAVQAIWKSRYDTVSILLDEHGVCMVPQEVLARRSRVQVNLVGFTASDGTLTARLTSYPAFVLDVDVKAELYGSRSEEITPTQFERFVSQVAETARLASESASNASESADRAQASASAAATSEISALNSMTAASNSELSASESALSASGSADTASENALDASNSADRAETARAFLEGVSADATTLAPGSQATASYDEGVFSFGIPQGLKGDTGAQGPKGDKGDKGDGSYDDTEVRGLLADESRDRASADNLLEMTKADKTEINELATNKADKTEVNALGERVTTAENDIDVLDARMGTFASLPDGSTSGDAELLDIRIGADGTTYPSAGDAVRGQVSDLKSDINEDEELLGKTVSYNTGEELYDSSSIITGKYAYGDVGSAVSIASANNNIYQIVNVSDGEEYILSGRAFNDAFHYMAVFVDENDIILEKDRPTVESTSAYTDYHVIVPTNAVKMYFNSVVSVPNSIKKVLSTSTAFDVPYSALSSEVQVGLSRTLANANKVLIFGDSWTATGSSASTKKWCDYVQEELQFDMSNFASSGTGYKAGSSYIGKRINDKIVVGFSGFIVVFGSGNDCRYMASEVGTINDIYDPLNGTGDTVAGRINYAFNVIKTKAPLAKVLIISPCAWQIYPPTNPSNAMIEYCDLLKQCAVNAGFMYVDMYNNSGLRPWDDSQADYWYEQSPTNRVHPNDAGQYFLYPQMRELIKKILPNIEASN